MLNPRYYGERLAPVLNPRHYGERLAPVLNPSACACVRVRACARARVRVRVCARAGVRVWARVCGVCVSVRVRV